MDAALEALIEKLEGAAELAALSKFPYEHDSDLSWEVSEGPPLPYAGEVPKEVIMRARARRRKR